MKPTEKHNILEKYFPNLIQDIGHIIQKGKIASRFTTLELSNDEIKEISKAKELCELKILELWNNQESEEFKALCSVYFDLATIISKDILLDEDIFETIKIIAFGYLGEHAHFVKEYLIYNKNKIDNIEISEKWNFRILRRCFQVIVSLVIKRSWKDISESINLINQLRNEQNQFETEYLNQVKEESQPYGAAEIVSLYHFAKTNELLGQYLLEVKVDGANFDIENKIKYHLKIAREFANASGNILLELLYQYFESFGIKLIRNTIGQ